MTSTYIIHLQRANNFIQPHAFIGLDYINFNTLLLFSRYVLSHSGDPMDYIACQAPLSMGYNRQEYWKVKVLVAQSCPTLCNPMDYNLPGSSVHGIL